MYSEEQVTADNPPQLRVRRRLAPAAQPKKLPQYAIILHNDEANGFEWVIGVLQKVIRCSSSRAIWLTIQAHVTGQKLVWSGSLEVAELKVEQIRSCGPDPDRVSHGALPLRVSIEPLPE